MHINAFNKFPNLIM